MSNVFFTSDLHFGHRKAANHRGFDDVSEHDRAIVRNWQEAVQPDDVVWVLGDIAASSPTYSLALLDVLPGTKHLILGNHEQAHPMHRDAHKHLRKYLDVFESVAQSARRRIACTVDGEDENVEVLMSHFPYFRDRGIVRHTQWRLPYEGRWLLHGHTHGGERLTAATKEIHVGVDAWDLTPVSLSQISEIISKEETQKAALAKLMKAMREPTMSRENFERDAAAAQMTHEAQA